MDDRLVTHSDLPLERELLRAAIDDGPSSAARRRSLAALGLLTVAAPAGAGVAAVSAKAGLPLVSKVLIGLVLGGGVVVGGTIVWSATNTSSATVVSAPSPAPTALDSEAVPRPPARAFEPSPAEPTPSAAVSAGPRRAANPQPTVAQSSAVDATSSIREEVQLLDTARRALARGATAEALAALATYDTRFPAGTLRREAAKLHAQAARRPSTP